MCVAGCATRHPEAMTPLAPVAASVIWRIEEGDLLKVRVYGQTELNSEPIVNEHGTAFFPGLGRVVVAGLSNDSLESTLTAAYGKIIRNPAVQVTMQREITLYGQVRTPGIYAIEPGATLLGIMARAGGQSASGAAPEVMLEKSDGRRFLMPREARIGSIDVHRTDAVYMSAEGFFSKNASALSATSLVVSTLSTIIGLVLIISR